MQWCITPADVSALKQAIGPLVFGCAILGTVTAVGVVAALNAALEWFCPKKEGSPMVPWSELMHARLDAERFEEERDQALMRI